jgi:uncharacterized membrane protein
MPPPKSDEAPMPEAEIALVAAWIRALGQAGTPIPPVLEPAPPAPPAPAPEPPQGPRSMREAIGLAHVLVLHFPIALVLAALASEVWGLARRQAAVQLPITRFLLVLGALGAVLAAFTGWWAAEVQGYRDATVFRHRWLGVAATAVTILAALAYAWHARRPRSSFLLAARVLLVLAAALVALAGHYGGALIHPRSLLPF